MSQSRKKILVITGASLLGLFVLGIVGAYFYVRSHLKDAPEILKASLAKKQITLQYEKVVFPAVGLSMVLEKTSLSGNLPVSVQADSLSVGVGWGGAWPPIALTAAAQKPVLTANPNYVPEKKEETAAPPPTHLKWLGIAVPFLKVNVDVAALSGYGIENLTAHVTVKDFRISESGLDGLKMVHALSIQRIEQAPWLLGFNTNGTTLYDRNKVSTREFKVGLGPLLVDVEGKLDVPSQTWSAVVWVPKADLSKTQQSINTQAVNWVKPIAGEAQIRIEASGEGTAPEKLQAQGTINLNQANFQITHADAKGNLVTTVYTTFSKGKDTIIDLRGELDLTELGISHEDVFAKERGVPLKLNANLKGNEDLLSFPSLEILFHNLNVSADGTFSQKNHQLQLHFKVPQTDLVGWEKFFPKYSQIRTQGSLEASGSLQGSTEDLKSGNLQLDLKARDIKIPILKSWIPNKDLQVEGVAELSSVTKLELAASAIRTLSTETQIDLEGNQIAYGEMFHKKTGVPLAATLSIQSTGNKADIRSAQLQMGTLQATAKGSIQNFQNPVANLKIETTPFQLTELLSFLPTAKAKPVSQMNGVVALKAAITGPVLSKEGPGVSGSLDLKRLALIYEIESTKKKIQLNQLSGTLNFTKDSASTKLLQMVFPRTDLKGAFEIRDFAKPSISFSVQGNRFDLADFYDLPKGQAVPPGALPVPVKSSKEDFRTNPVLQNMKMKGSATLRNVDLGYAKSDYMMAALSLDNLLLQVNPFVINLYGGKITSTMEWNGRPKIPTTKQTLKVENVNANQFISSYAEKGKDVLEGLFSTDMDVSFSGMEPEEIKKTVSGKGSFKLREGRIKTVRFTKGPLESLQKIPFLGKGITKTDWDEKLNESTGNFEFKEGTLLLSNLVLHAPYFDATMTNAAIDLNQNLKASMIWIPKENLLTGESYEALKDESGKTSLPLNLGGTLTSPSVSLDQSVIEARIKGYASRKLEAEKNKALREAQKKAEEELKKKLNQGLGNIFK